MMQLCLLQAYSLQSDLVNLLTRDGVPGCDNSGFQPFLYNMKVLTLRFFALSSENERGIYPIVQKG